MATAPGLNISVQDGGLVASASAASTASVLIIGTAGSTSDVVAQEVNPTVALTEGQYAAAAGTTLQMNDALARGWYQAIMTGCRSVRIQKLEGTTAAKQYTNLHKIFRNLEDYEVDAVIICGLAGNEVPTGVTFEAGTDFDYAALTAPVVAASDPTTLTVTTTSATLAGHTGNTVNRYIVPGSVVIKQDDTVLVEGTGYTLNYLTGVITFSTAPGEDVVTATYNYYDFDEDKADFMHQLAGYCELVSSRNRVTHGFIPLGAAGSYDYTDTTLADRNAYINALTATPIVLSKYVCVLGGPRARFEWKDGTLYYDQGIAAVGTYCEILPTQTSPTNKAPTGPISLEYDLSASQLDKMCTANILCFRRRSSGVVITDGLTTAGAVSDYTRFTTSKIIKDVINSCRIASEPYIGAQNTIPQRQALRTAIDSALSAMQSAGALEAYKFNVSVSSAGTIDGNVIVDVWIVPIFEIRTISISVTLSSSL